MSKTEINAEPSMAYPNASSLDHPICQLAKQGEVFAVQKALEESQNTGQEYQAAASKIGRAALVASVLFNQLKVFVMLLGHGAEVNTVYKGKSILLWTILYSRQIMSLILLDLGADPRHEDTIHLRQALAWSCFAPNITMVKELLLRSEVEIDRLDRTGKTALMIACDRKALVIVEELLKHGASNDLVDHRRGWTATQWLEHSKADATIEQIEAFSDHTGGNIC